MKTFWKVLGAAALAVGLTPYHIEKNQETGEKKYKALLWQATKTPKGDGENDALDITVGFNLPTSEEHEPHLFSDELCVEYTGVPVTEEASSESPSEKKEQEPPVEPAAPAESPAETAAEKEKEEA